MRSGIRAQHLLLACILLLYFAFLTKTYYWDGVLFSLDIESVRQGLLPAAALLHPNHLIYNAVGYLIYSALSALLPGIRAIAVLQWLNVLASVFGGYVLFLIARRTTTTCAAVFCWLLFASGATWWKFSTDADSYIVCVLLLVLSAYFFLVKFKIVPAALCHVSAMLFHELAIFTYVPVLAWLLVDFLQPLKKRIAFALVYWAATASIVAGAYWLCYAAANHTVYPTLLSWITSYSSDKTFSHSIAEIFAYYMTSYLKLFAGGKVGFIREFFGFAECAALVCCLALMAWAIRLVKRPQTRVEPDDVPQRALVFLWTWFIAYATFLALWDPGSAFHKLLVWPAIVLLIGIYLRRNRYARERMRAFTAFAGALAAWNFAAFIYPHSHATADPVLMLAEQVDRELPADATIYFRALDPDDWYLEYFAPGRRWIRLPAGMDTAALLRSTAGPICLETTALDDFRGAIDPRLKWDLINGSHNVRLECLARPQ